MRSVREKGLIDHATFPRYHTLPHVTMNHTLIPSMITVRLSNLEFTLTGHYVARRRNSTFTPACQGGQRESLCAGAGESLLRQERDCGGVCGNGNSLISMEF